MNEQDNRKLNNLVFCSRHYVPLQVSIQFDENRPEHNYLLEQLLLTLNKLEIELYDVNGVATKVSEHRDKVAQEDAKLELQRQRVRELRAQREVAEANRATQF